VEGTTTESPSDAENFEEIQSYDQTICDTMPL
jgi:hypothetical protein